VIPTVSDAAGLDRCLARIHRSRYPKHLIEAIVVVDGRSVDDAAHVARRRGAIVVKSAGSAADRLNRGTRAALGDIVAVLYPHVEVDEEWISNLVRTLATNAAWFGAEGFAVRRAPLEAAGGFDGSAGDEAIGLCRRLARLKYSVVFAPQPTVAA
jgi:glycosyltransferase involved in cell wall biosynthesis